MAGDINHLVMKEILAFLGLGRQDFLRKEGRVFPPLPRNSEGRRWTDVYAAARIYELVWGMKPGRQFVSDFLFDIGYVDKDKSELVLLRLTSRGLLK